MIAVAFGQPGVGKTTFAVGMVREYLEEGRRVVSNFPLNHDALETIRTRAFREHHRISFIEPRPPIQTLDALGYGWHPKAPGDEQRCGLLVVDEAGTWINARNWKDDGRIDLVKWFTLSRKLGWDVLLLVQHPNLIDAQVREACVEVFGRIIRTDRKKVPILGISLPRFHIAVFRYGMEASAIKLFHRIYRGSSLHKFFDTHYLFKDFLPYSPLFLPRISKAEKHQLDLKFSRKHPLIERIMRLPDPRQRLDFFRRFEQCGAFA